MKKMISFCLLAGLLAACSQGGGSNNSGPGTSKFHESYHLSLNGCDTGKHDFDSNVSYEEMHKQLCNALQDDALNASCAESVRRDYFTQNCAGMTWNPVYKQNQPVTPGENGSGPSTGGDDALKTQKIKEALERNLVDKYTLTPSLPVSDKQIAASLGEDLMSCGISYLGPKCLGSDLFVANYNDLFTQADGKSVFYSEVNLQGFSTPIAFVFKLNQIQPTVQIGEVEIFKILKPSGIQHLEPYLNDPTSVASLLKLSLVSDFRNEAAKRLQNPRDIRELYHLSALMLEDGMNANTYTTSLALVEKSFKSHKDLIVTSHNSLYQENIVLMAIQQVHLMKADLMALCEGLLQSSNGSPQQMAATLLLEDQPTRSELKSLVLAALNHSNWMIRKKAIGALSATQKTTAEENQLLKKIADSDADVRDAAITADAKISVSDSHLATVLDLSTKGPWEVRVEAAKLLSRINSNQSIHALIGMMGDSDQDVQSQVKKQLDQKNLDDSKTDDFSQLMNGHTWEVRRDAAAFLGKIGSDKALLVLIDSLDDSDQDVQSTVMSILSKVEIKDSFVQPLAKQYNGSTWEVRRDVSTLLGKNTSLAATQILIAHMDDSDKDVLDAVNSSLEKRTLPGEVVSDLKAQFTGSTYEVRQEVAKLLGTIKTKDSLAALEAQLKVETDADVKKQIEASIKALKS